MKKLTRSYLISIVAAVIVVAGTSCYFIAKRDQNPCTPMEARTEIMLYCGAGIRSTADELIAAFENKQNIKVNANYAGGGRQLVQISAIQKGDLFMPGDEVYVDRAIEKGLAEESTKQIVAYFVPVIFVKKGNPENIKSLADLERNGLKLGFGDERLCAVGIKTLKIFEKNNVDYKEIEKNVVYKSSTVNELGVAIQLGNVDAVILWDVNARHFGRIGTVVPIQKRQNIISAIPIVLLKSSRHPGEAKRFIDFITSEDGKKIFKESGYTILFP